MKNRGMWNSKMNLHSQPGASAWAMTIRMMAMPLAIDMVVSRFIAMGWAGVQAIHGIAAIWCGFAGTASVDLTIIGHIKGWKTMKYQVWLGGFIYEKRRYGYELVSDCKTHPQIIFFLFGALLVLVGIIGLNVGVWQFVNDINVWILWAINVVLYVPSIICLFVLKSFARRTYLSCFTQNK